MKHEGSVSLKVYSRRNVNNRIEGRERYHLTSLTMILIISFIGRTSTCMKTCTVCEKT